MDSSALQHGNPLEAIKSVPPGAWLIGVSGGADSVALLRLAHDLRPDLKLHAAHLDHELRGEASAGDAAFVLQLCEPLGVGRFIGRRSELESNAPQTEANPSARYRKLRYQLFRQLITASNLDGVLLAHHADDQAETILHRTLGNATYRGLAGIQPRARVHGVTVLRPLLGVRRAALRNYLDSIGQPWREDASNQSPKYARNRIRQFLAAHPSWTDLLLELGRACNALSRWTSGNAPELPSRFATRELQAIPDLLAHEAIRRWLIESGAPPRKIDAAVLARFATLARDAASPSAVPFPGHLIVRRRGGMIFRESDG